MAYPVVLLFKPHASSLSGVSRALTTDLKTLGFQVHEVADAGRIGAHLEAAVGSAPAARCLVLLGGNQAENLAVAAQLSMRHPGVGLAALADSAHDIAMTQLLQGGVDMLFPLGASSGLLATGLSRLWVRISQGGFVAPAQAEPAAPSDDTARWRLEDQGWVLVSPGHQRVVLTTGERAFVTTLLAAPGLRATHADLIDAINASYALDSPSMHHSRLGVMVSRLRRKFVRHGLEFPIKSMHSWGYMFTGQV